MKKIIFPLFLILLISVLSASAQAEELAGTWIEFLYEDVYFFRFSPEDSVLTILWSYGYTYDTYQGKWKADGQAVIFTRDDEGYSYDEELPYSFEEGKLRLEWYGTEHICERIDDSLFPEDPESSPFIGENREYWFFRLEDGTTVISGYAGNAETVTVPDSIFGVPVDVIGGTSFSSIEGLKHVTVPHGVTSIGAQAFSYSDELESVELPDTLERLGYGAFEYCTALKEVVLPESLPYLEADTFWGCESLQSVTLPAGLQEIDEGGAWDENTAAAVLFKVQSGSYAEWYCQENGLSYVISDGTAASEESALSAEFTGTWLAFFTDEYSESRSQLSFLRFEPNSGALSVIEGRGEWYQTYTGFYQPVRSVITLRNAEYGTLGDIPCELSDGKLIVDWNGERVYERIDDGFYPEDPDHSPWIGGEADYTFSRLEDGTIRIDYYQNTASETAEVPGTVLGYPVTSIGDGAFMSASGLKTVVLPEGIVSIGQEAFDSASDLESITLPGTLESIGYSAFAGCSSLREIVIPEGVKVLEGYTFVSCGSLEKAVLPESLEQVDWPNFTGGNTKFIVPPGSYAEQYCRDQGFSYYFSEEDFANPEGAADGPAPEAADDFGELPEAGNEERYKEAMELFGEEKYYSARQAFIESGYGDWEEMAVKCIREMPATGEIWRDRSQWLQDMELTIVVGQPRDTAMFVRIFKDSAPVSYLFINGSEPVTVRLPGNGYYTIKDGIGDTWYGMKEAFGPEGRYESMIFDDRGSERVYLQSYYAYTLSINFTEATPGGEDVTPESRDWGSFIE